MWKRWVSRADDNVAETVDDFDLEDGHPFYVEGADEQEEGDSESDFNDENEDAEEQGNAEEGEDATEDEMDADEAGADDDFDDYPYAADQFGGSGDGFATSHGHSWQWEALVQVPTGQMAAGGENEKVRVFGLVRYRM